MVYLVSKFVSLCAEISINILLWHVQPLQTRTKEANAVFRFRSFTLNEAGLRRRYEAGEISYRTLYRTPNGC